jgi:hypothetical protein
MNHRKEVADCRGRSRRFKAGIACLVLGMLAACGGGGGSDDSVAVAGAAPGASSATTLASRTTVVERTDPIVQSGKSATMKLADRKCARRARTDAGDGAARKAMRQSARREACEAERESNG